MKLVLMSLVLALAAPAVSGATQTPQQNGPTASAPAFVRLDGALTGGAGGAGEARRGATVLVISIYAGQGDTAALWSERQAVTLDDAGRYTVFAGATQAEGLPREFFASSTAQWIGVAVEGEPEQPRVRMVSVPYALTAANAETLGGLAVKDFVMSDNLAESVKKALTGDEAKAAARDGDPTIMGTSGRIAKFDATGLAANIVDSVMSESGSNIGIGTTAPIELLHLNSATNANNYNRWSEGGVFRGVFGIDNGLNGYLIGVADNDFVLMQSGNINLKASAASSGGPHFYINTSGLVGIGTTTPTDLLHINSIPGSRTFIRFSEGSTFRAAFGVETGGAYLTGTADNDFALLAGSNLAFGSGGGGAPKLYVTSGGNIGIGTTSPTSTLHVAGTANVTGDVTVGGNIGAKYQDVAEWVETGEPLEVGTVVIVAAGELDQVVPSLRAYDTRVAGAVSRQPGLILGERGDSKSLIAQSGRVRIKVDATFGAIKPGDLLVTSPTPGHAMLSKPLKIGGQLLHRPGTLVGKALEGLPGGKGEILVLLTLQ